VDEDDDGAVGGVGPPGGIDGHAEDVRTHLINSQGRTGVLFSRPGPCLLLIRVLGFCDG
jgi:hypothetical protein